MFKIIARFLLSFLVTISTVTFILVNVPVVRDVAKSKMPLVLGALVGTEILAIAVCLILLYYNNILSLWKNRISPEGESFVVSLTGFTTWITLKFPIWTRWGFINRYCEINKIDASQYEPLFYQGGVIAALVCIPFLYIGWRWLYQQLAPGAVQFFRSFSPHEWLYFGLYWGIGTVILAIIAIQSSVFTYPMPIENKTSDFPMGISVSDSALLIDGDTFCNNTSSANDIRQPLLAVFSAPFAMIAHVLAILFSFSLPGLFGYKYVYSVAIAFLQIGSFAVVGVIIKRIIASFTDESFAWSVVLLYSVAYSTVVFALTVEQYAFSLLALIIFIGYSVLIRQNQTEQQQQEDSIGYDLMAMAAIGTIATSIIPVIYFFTATAKSVKSFINSTLELIAVGLGSVIVFSKFGLLFNLNQRVEALSVYADIDSSQLGPVNKIEQYLHFVYSILFSPAVLFQDGVVLQVLPQDIPPTIYLSAIVISAVCVISAILFIKVRFVQCCFLWILFGFFLMGVMGWGSRENGMMLYSSYFGWAYIPLIVLPIYKITGNNYLKLGACAVVIIAVMVSMETFDSVCEIVRQSKDFMLLNNP